MEPFDFNRLIFGDDFADRKAAFEQRLKEIESKYSYWFEKRPGQFDYQKHDELSNHHLMSWDHHATRFSFNKDSDLPADIRTECIAAFDELFNR